MSNHTLLKQAAAAVVLFGALPAAAGPATYAGGLCTSVSGFGTPSIYRSGRLVNTTGSTLEVVCPVQRNVTVTNLNEDVSVLVTVVDASLDDDVRCTATVTEADGTAVLAGSGQTSGADTANAKSISINLAPALASFFGYITVRCELPKTYAGFNSVLASIYVSE
ncbi:hypothetical protein NVS55_04790 [Myxococcus stipitatus]|uniref:hypothetical protein n=1 Tax=Myxococcus stipitatus TaxID=83455 RepID=UPI0031455540